MICPSCQEAVSEGKKFCGKCGAVLSAVASPAAQAKPPVERCPKCGSEVGVGKKFCGACGSTVGVKEKEPTAPPPQTRPLVPTNAAQIPPAAPRPTVPSAEAPHTPLSQWSASGSAISAGVPHPPKKMPSVSVVGLFAAMGVLLLAGGIWVFWGVELDLATVPGSAEVKLDGKPVGQTAAQDGSLVLPHLTHGTHVLTIAQSNFDEWKQPVVLGWFELRHPLAVSLQVPTFALKVLTDVGGARIQIDGQDSGVTNVGGILELSSVPRGQHLVTAFHDGYPSESSTIVIAAPTSVRLDFAASALASGVALPQTAQQPAVGTPPAVSVEQANRLLDEAENLFRGGEYKLAQQSCDAALRLDPNNSRALQLKTKIQETLRVLGNP